MFIRTIEIENIGGFEEVHLDLDRGDGTLAGWTVLAGPNGSGKSTLLKALALACAGPRWATSLQKSFAGWVRRGSKLARCRVKLDAGERDQLQEPLRGHTAASSTFAALRWEMKNGGPEPDVSSDGVPASCLAGPWATNPEGWFIAGYGPFRRIGQREERDRAGAQVLTGLATLFDEDATLGEAIRWLKHDVYGARLDRLERARKLKEKTLIEDAGPLEEEAESLDRLHYIVLSLLNDGLLPKGARVVDFDMDGLWIEQAGVTLPLRQLSDGYRAVAALVFDILRQLHACYRGLEVEVHPGPPVVPYDGIVLIDEIEAHLHPAWQKEIGFWLKRHFPNIQFIVSTHSPFICQAADRKGLIRLPLPGDGQKVEQVSEEDFRLIVNGGADDAVLSTLFGLTHSHSEMSERRRQQASELEVKVLRGTATEADVRDLQDILAQLPDTGDALMERVLRKHEALR